MSENFNRWAVIVDGRDVSIPMRPFLTSIEVDDQPGAEADAARLSLDDAGGVLKLPPVGGAIVIAVNGATLFEGVVDSTPWSITKSNGRVLEIIASALDLRGRAKDRQRWHLDDAPLGDALRKAAKQAGFTIEVDPAFAGIERDYWSPDNASFLAWAQQLAKEHGATFKVSGTRAVFAKRGTGRNVFGTDMPTIKAVVGRNVIAARIDPTMSRHRFGRAEAQWFDRETATYKRKRVDLTAPDLDATNHAGVTFHDEAQADAFLEGRRIDDERASAVGTIEMDFTPEARAEGTVNLSGARPGIDGTYRIVSVQHQVTRSNGSTTTLSVGQAQGEAGKDSRLPTTGNVPIPTPAPR